MPVSAFIWYELMTSDLEAAEAFYKAVMGWTMRSHDGPIPYRLAGPGAEPVAGLMAIPEDAKAHGARPGWLGYIGVSDVDETVRRIEAAGGKTHRAPMDIPGVGRFAVVADPHGAVFQLLAPQGEGRLPEPGALGTFSWRELMAGDLDSAFAFYSGLFGWTKTMAVDMGPMGTYQTFATGGPDMTGGMVTKPAMMPQPFWQFYVQVDGIDAAVERVSAAGGQTINGPHEVPGGSWIANCQDPQGAYFSLTSRSR